MVVIGLSRRERSPKLAAAAICAMLVISSAAMIGILSSTEPLDTSAAGNLSMLYQNRPFEVKSVQTEDGSTWVSFDSSPPGTPAEAHVTISDTSGITITADFHGFWRGNITINGTVYDDLEMPGASSTQIPGTPMVPCLFEYVEIPHDVDVGVEVIASSSDSTSEYSIRPTPLPIVPIAMGEPTTNVTPYVFEPTFFDSLYSNDTFFPGNTTSIEGGSDSAKMVMRGHRIIGLSFYPVQYNPVSANLTVYSQLVVRLKYNVPAQILPIAESLRSEAFERILLNTLLNYDSCHSAYATLTGSGASDTTPPLDSQEGAEYLVITNGTFRTQAHKLVNWKKQKGVPSAVEFLPGGLTQDELRNSVKGIVSRVYSEWNPVPTYVVLLGDVDVIPANYDVDYEGNIAFLTPLFQDISREQGNIASDLGYFDIEGNGYFPDFIYGRISVDTVEQAEIVVDKILQYEKDPPMDESFYNNMLTAGYFQDYDDRDGVEDAVFPFIYTLETIRHYLRNEFGYNTHVNYSCAWEAYDSEDWNSEDYDIPLESLKFQKALEATGSELLIDSLVADSIPHEFRWLKGYDAPSSHYYEDARKNITANFNDGRFLVLYYGHGGSKNMIYPIDIVWPWDGYSRNERDLVEGWHQPYYNTSYFSDLMNEHQTPVIVSIACSTGWFDGETDEGFLDLFSPVLGRPNPFEDYANECFAENITRLAGGGAIAIIAPSRPAHSVISGHLLDGIIQALYPGHLGSENQPIHELGAALLFGKLYSATQWTGEGLLQWFDWLLHPEHVIRTTFEEYHLFGDPEIRLWTDAPTWVNVSYPDTVGTTYPQRFVVTVCNSMTGDPIRFAKVCIQQGDPVYDVRYTDSNGQAIFDVNPSPDYSHMNVTVTKHNVRTHTGTIGVVHSDASISVSPSPIIEEDILTITFNEFLAEVSKIILVEGNRIADLAPGVSEYQWPVFSGPTQYLNVLVWSSTGVAVDRYQRVSSDEGPDPWIHTQTDQVGSAENAGEVVWDHPDIDIYQDGVQVDWMTQNEVHDIEVTVYNNGIIAADSTTVTLSSAPFGGGVTWTPIGEATVSPTHDTPDTATFTFTPILAHGTCLRVDLSHPDERADNMGNNVGYENVNVIEMSSPGTGTLYVGNPTDTADYVFVEVKQIGSYEDIWNATIRGYSSQPMSAGANEIITLHVDSISDMQPHEWRLFKAEIHIDCMCVGGIVFNASHVEPPVPPDNLGYILILVSGGIAVIVVYLVTRRRR